jgi:transposase
MPGTQSYTRREPVVPEPIIFVGLDVHADSIAVAVAEAAGGEPRSLGTIPNAPEAVAKLVRKLGPAARRRVCYEAGPCGYVLHRRLTELGAAAVVVAPSLVPTKPGDKVKTDRRDALKLARLHRAGELTAVWVPDEAHEALRDLTRAREDAVEALHRARQQLRSFLLRQGRRPPAGVKPWTLRHRDWLATLRLAQPAQQAVLAEALTALDQGAARLGRLEDAIRDLAAGGPLAPLVDAVQALRGVGLVTAATLAAELGDLTRFASPRQAMAYVGLVPGEHSSGGRTRRGGVTKTGNAHARRVLVGAAWHYRHPPRVGAALRRRQAGQSAAVIGIAWRAQDRLHRRYRRLVGRGKLKQQAVVAVARELVGFLWAIARQVAAADARPASAHTPAAEARVA